MKPYYASSFKGFISLINFFFIKKDAYATYNESCSTYTCYPGKNLVCSSGSGTGCSCPATLGGGYCDCPSTMYWDGTTCATRLLNGSYCTGDYQCKISGGLVCSSNACACSSASTYWDSTSATCRKLI